MSGYVFLSNSNKPNEEEQYSRDPVTLTNVSRPCLEKALDMGYEVWFGTNRDKPENLECELPIHMYDSHTYRSIFNLKDNIIAYKNLMKILKNNDIEVIHCNTPIGGMIGRICGKKARIKHIIYTAHGFHFYKGAPFINNTLFKWIEQIMALCTDVIITINQEDYEAAQKFKLKTGGKIFYVPGVGINLDEYKKTNINIKIKKHEMGLDSTEHVLISVGRLDKNKNNSTLIKALKKIKDSKVHLLICGEGKEKKKLQKLAGKLNLEKQVHFLGSRSDMKELYQISDIFVMASHREGLSRAVMEAMASGLPCVISDIRGNRDLIIEGKGGYLVKKNNVDEYAKRINELIQDRELRIQMEKENIERIKAFSAEKVKKRIKDIYKEIL